MCERKTTQKAAILDVLRSAQGPIGVKGLLARAREVAPRLSQATVYRVLKALVERKTITCVQLPGQSPLYEMTDRTHHHFFRCRRCDRVYKTGGCDELLKRLVPEGCRLQGHDVFLYGTCADCTD